jgi:hypothetical protein
MTSLLEGALERVQGLSRDEQDAIASQILDSMADEEAWQKRFAASPDRLRRLAGEARDEDRRGETRPLGDPH